VATLAPDVVLHRPVTFHPYGGRETVGGILRFVSGAFDGRRCIEALHEMTVVIRPLSGLVALAQAIGPAIGRPDGLRLAGVRTAASSL
jgi:hypothetical protein